MNKASNAYKVDLKERMLECVKYRESMNAIVYMHELMFEIAQSSKNKNCKKPKQKEQRCGSFDIVWIFMFVVEFVS